MTASHGALTTCCHLHKVDQRGTRKEDLRLPHPASWRHRERLAPFQVAGQLAEINKTFKVN